MWRRRRWSIKRDACREGCNGEGGWSYSVRRSRLRALSCAFFPPFFPFQKGLPYSRWIIGVTLDVTCSVDPANLRTRELLASFSPYLTAGKTQDVRCKTNVSILTGMTGMMPATKAYESFRYVRRSPCEKQGPRRFFKIWTWTTITITIVSFHCLLCG